MRRALRARPVAVVLQPRAHNPTGVSTTAARAEQLVRVLRRPRDQTPWIVEDDHSSGISIAPDVSLGSWLPDRVVHVRSYSKSHGPDLRIASLGGPSEIVDRIVARRMLGPAWTSRMVQTILLDLLTTSQSLDEVAEARRQYMARQRTLVGELEALGIPLAVPDGINMWLPVRDERAALLQLAASGIRVAGAPRSWRPPTARRSCGSPPDWCRRTMRPGRCRAGCRGGSGIARGGKRARRSPTSTMSPVSSRRYSALMTSLPVE